MYVAPFFRSLRYNIYVSGKGGKCLLCLDLFPAIRLDGNELSHMGQALLDATESRKLGIGHGRSKQNNQ